MMILIGCLIKQLLNKNNSMPKISWNDINDSDSSLSSDHEQLETIPPVSVKKTLSVPPSHTEPKLKAACDELSLSKLSHHNQKDVWLFIPNSFYEEADLVHQILEKSHKLKKVNRVKGVGWNVLAQYENAKKLIQEGIQEDQLLIKFIYSTRNDNKNNLSEDKPLKCQKKVTYVEKVNKVPVMEKSLSAVQEVSVKKEQKSSNIKTNDDKPKKKWVQKSNSMIDSEKKYMNSDRMRSPKGNEKIKDVKSPKRYTQKVPSNNCPEQSKVEANQVKPKQQGDEVPSYIVPASVKPVSPIEETMDIQSPEQVLPIQKAKIQIDVLSDDSSLEVQDKKRKKQKKKKNKNGKGEKKDSNNPFSYFSQN